MIYVTFLAVIKKYYNRHLHTAKHIRMTNNDKNTLNFTPYFHVNVENSINIDKGCMYHKKNCNKLNEEYTKDINNSHSVQVPPQIDSSLVIELLKQNQEFKRIDDRTT